MHPTAQLFRSSFDALEAMNFEGVVDPLADDVEIVIKPSSMGPIPTLGKQEFYQMMKGSFGWFAPGGIKFVFDEVYELKKPENAVVVIAHSDGTSKNGTSWHNENMYVVEPDEEGRKIRKIVEFMDSGFMKSFIVEEAKNAGGA